MSLEEVLRKAVEHINSGSLTNEAQVKQSVIVPILRALDWDDTDPAEFVPEFSVDNRWVDYALLGSGIPLVFIEAKGLGLVGADGEEQVFGYAAHRGVPFLLLTDGNLWDFYLSMAEGVPAERRFYRAELTREERIPEYVEFLETYFRKGRIVSGDAYDEALKRHRSNRERNKASRAIPSAWQTLVRLPDQERGELLRELLAEEVESQCGTKPNLDDVEKFLKELLSDSASTTTHRRSSQSTTTLPPQSKKSASTLSRTPEIGLSTSSKSSDRNRKSTSVGSKWVGKPQSTVIGFEFDGKRYETGTAYRTLAEVLKALDRRAPDFMECLAKETVGRKNRLVARNRNDLYTDPKRVEKSTLDLGNGWWLGHNLSTAKIQRHIKTACEVAGVKFGSELKLIER